MCFHTTIAIGATYYAEGSIANDSGDGTSRVTTKKNIQSSIALISIGNTPAYLWPFPNKDAIRIQMRAYNLHSVDRESGFCADIQTLTKYIREYVGNPIPSEKYGASKKQTYFVRPLGGNYGREDGSDYDNAWDGFANIDFISLASNLPAIFYVCGTHTAQLTVKAGGAGEKTRLTIRGDYTGDLALLDGGDSVKYGIYVEDYDYVTIANFKIKDYSRGGIGFRLHADHGLIQDCSIDSCGKWGIYAAHVNNLVIQDNTCTNSQIEHGIYLANNSDDCIIRGNTCYGNKMTGININGDGHVLERVLVEKNIIFNNGLTLDLACVHDSTIQNNLIYNSSTKGMVLWDTGYGKGYGCENNKVVNNTIHMTPAADREGILVKGYSTKNTILNNIIYSESSHCIEVRSDSTAGTKIDYNHYYNNFPYQMKWAGSIYSLPMFKSLIGQDRHSHEGDPLFVNISGGDFHLQSTSPCKDTGTSFNAPSDDLEGTTRPQGAAHDKGAYDYTDSATNIPPSANSTNRIVPLTVDLTGSGTEDDEIVSWK